MNKLVLFEFHLLGDAAMSLPFLRAARTQYDVYVCCSPAAAKAYELVLPAERIFRAELSASGRNSAALKAVRDLQADIGVTVWADVRVHLLMRRLGIPERVGFPMNERNYYGHHVAWRARNLRIGKLIQAAARAVGIRPLTTALARRDYLQHHVTTWAQLGESLGVAPEVETPWLEALAAASRCGSGMAALASLPENRRYGAGSGAGAAGHRGGSGRGRSPARA